MAGRSGRTGSVLSALPARFQNALKRMKSHAVAYAMPKNYLRLGWGSAQIPLGEPTTLPQIPYSVGGGVHLPSTPSASRRTFSGSAPEGNSLAAKARKVRERGMSPDRSRTTLSHRRRRRGRHAGGTCPLKFGKNIFRAISVKFGHFSAKDQVKFGNFVLILRENVIKIRVFC